MKEIITYQTEKKVVLNCCCI